MSRARPILPIIVLIGLLAMGWLLWSLTTTIGPADRTLKSINTLSRHTGTFFHKHGHLPDSLTELDLPDTASLQDAWGRPIVMTRPTQDRYELRSTGPDGAFSPDDIVRSFENGDTTTVTSHHVSVK